MSLLNERLLAVAQLVEQGKVVADIGTDHAFLPIYLVREGIASRVIACDIAEGPLSVAKKNILRFGLSESIELRLANGLAGLAPKECTAITICGMGGETIADILSDAPWVRSSDVSIVLQPMSCDDRLRHALAEEGFGIESERAVFSKGRVYTIMRVRYGVTVDQTDITYPFIGKLLEHPDKPALFFVKRRLKSLQTCMTEIATVERKQALYHTLQEVTEAIQNKLNMF